MNSVGYRSFAAMPPTFAAAMTIASRRWAASHFSTSSCLVRSRSRRSATITSHCSVASLRRTAEPTMPRCPAIHTRFPASGNMISLTTHAPSRLESRHAPRRDFQILANHFIDEIVDRRLMSPSEFRLSLAWVAEKDIDLGRAKVTRIDLDPNPAVAPVEAFLLRLFAAPFDLDADASKRLLDEGPNRMLLASCKHVVVGLRLLQHQPHAFYVFSRVTPVALSV